MTAEEPKRELPPSGAGSPRRDRDGSVAVATDSEVAQQAAEPRRRRLLSFGRRSSRTADHAEPVGPSAETGAAPASSAPDTTDVTQPADGTQPADADVTQPADAEPAGGSSPDPQGTAVAAKEPLPTERPPGAPVDPWTAFATTAERPPGLIRRAARVLVRSLIHEYALVIYCGLLLAIALTWPTLRYPLYTLPHDLGEPARQAWQVSWAGHILLTDPARWWQSNAFYPESNSYAFGNSLLGYAPFGMLGSGPLAATLRYNLLLVLAQALLAIGGYALVRQLGAGRTGAALAAVAIAYAPWRLAQEGRLDIVSAAGIPLALAMLARGHGWSLRYGLRPERRKPAWAVFGWLVATWQVTLGFSLGVPFLGVLGLVVAVLLIGTPIRRLRHRAAGPVLGWPLLVVDVLGPLITIGVATLIALPYFQVTSAGDSAAEIRAFSPPLRGLLIGPAESRLWGAPHAVARSSLGWPSDMALLPGFVLYALALAGIVFSVWKLWHRLVLLAALALTVILTLGTNFFGGHWTYLPLFGHLPAAMGTRVPGRILLWVTMLLAVLAAGAVAEFVRRAELWSAQRIPAWPAWWLRLGTLVPLMLVIAEGSGVSAHPVVPAQPAAMRSVTGPMLVLPTGQVGDAIAMLWSTSRYQPLVNGSGGFAAARQAEMRRSVATFPDVASIQYLRSLNVTTVLLLRRQTAGTPWEQAANLPVDTLGIRREDAGDTVIFHLN